MSKSKIQLMDQYPSISDLAVKAKKRIPNVAWEYLYSGTGKGLAAERNARQFDDILLTPHFMKGKLNVSLETELFGTKYQVPFGVAPVGLTGLVWPKAEIYLAQTAAKYGLPYTLSTVATQTPETVGKQIGNMGWFQLYPPKDFSILKDILKRASDSGFHTLIVTADVPAPGRREESRKAGLSMPPKITPKLAWEGITHPIWLYETLKNGLPSLKTVEGYCESKDPKEIAAFARFKFRGDLDWDYIKTVRDLWKGPIILKGLLHSEDVEHAVSIGMDGIGVSNHAGRQFDGAPTPISVLPEIASTVNGRAKIIFDSGISSGLDILKALSLGADFVLCGKAFVYGVAALGKYGGDHTAEILIEDLKNNMMQIGVEKVDELKTNN